MLRKERDTLQKPDNYCGVILAAGYSSRMQAFKPLLPVGEMTAIERSIAALKGAGVRNIAVVTGHNRESLLPVISKAGNIIEAYNEDYAKGMFSSIKTGLAAVRENFTDAKGIFLMPVDCPLISSNVLEILMNAIDIEETAMQHEAANADGAADTAKAAGEKTAGFFHVPVFEGKKGHPLMIPASYIDEICRYDGSGGLKAITDKYWDRMIRVPVSEEGCLLDMDTPAGYEEIKEFLEAGCERMPLRELAKGRRIFLVRHGQTRQHREKMFIGRYDVPLAEDAQADIKAIAEKIAQELEEKFRLDFSPEQWFLNTGALTTKASQEQNPVNKRKTATAEALHDGIAIYSSPLKRALQTAEIIRDELKKSETLSEPFNEEPNEVAGGITAGIKVHVEENLQEISLGRWDGRTIREIKEEFPEEYERRGRDIFAFKTGNKSENFYDVQYRAVKALRKILQEDEAKNIIIVSHSAVIRSLENNLKGYRVDDDWQQLAKGDYRVIKIGE